MTRELFWLTLTVILTGLLWVPYVLNRCQVRGLGGAMANPSRNDKPHAEWATRMMFAHDNAVENLVIFAPLVLILTQIDYSTEMDRARLRGVFLVPRRASASSTRWACRCSARWPSSSAFWRRPCWRWRSSRCFETRPAQRLLRAVTNSIAACSLSKPLTSPVSIDSELQLPALA